LALPRTIICESLVAPFGGKATVAKAFVIGRVVVVAVVGRVVVVITIVVVVVTGFMVVVVVEVMPGGKVTVELVVELVVVLVVVVGVLLEAMNSCNCGLD
jgi:hypothetical protein